MENRTKTETLSVIRLCSGGFHSWVRAKVKKGKDKGSIIEIRKPNI